LRLAQRCHRPGGQPSLEDLLDAVLILEESPVVGRELYAEPMAKFREAFRRSARHPLTLPVMSSLGRACRGDRSAPGHGAAGVRRKPRAGCSCRASRSSTLDAYSAGTRSSSTVHDGSYGFRHVGRSLGDV
jgi:hypothetical protein